MMVREGPIFFTPRYQRKNAITIENTTVNDNIAHPPMESLISSLKSR